MDLARFDRTARQIHEKNTLDIGFGADTAISLPVVVRRGDLQYDAMFLYRAPLPEEERSERPFAWILLDARSGETALISRCDLVDFMPEGRYPPGCELGMRHPKQQSAKKMAAMQEKVLEVYEEIRLFAFEEKLTRPQAAAVSVYKDLFERLTYPAHYPFYHALSPVFFHWLRMPLPVEAAGDAGGEAELKQDGYELVILQNLQQLVRQFQDKIASDAHKDKLFDEMHGELQAYKNDLLDALTQSLERDVIQVIDDVAKSVEAYRGREPTPDNYARLLELFAGVETDLVDLMYRHGAEPYREEAVDVTRQRIVSTAATADPALDKTVAAHLARGWEKNGKIIRPERVSVYVYKEGEREQ